MGFELLGGKDELGLGRGTWRWIALLAIASGLWTTAACSSGVAVGGATGGRDADDEEGAAGAHNRTPSETAAKGGEGGTTGGGAVQSSGGNLGDGECLAEAGNLVSSEGSVGGDPELRSDNPMCIQGTFYSYGDDIACPQVEGNPCTAGSCCVSGTTIVDPNYEAWGCGLGVTLNETGGEDPVQLPYDGPADCFSVELSGDTGGNPVRLGIRQFGDDSRDVAPYVEIPPVSGSATARVCLDDVSCPTWADSATCQVTGESYRLEIFVVGGDRAADVNLCLDSLIPEDVPDTGTGGTGGTGGVVPTVPEGCSIMYSDSFADFCQMDMECGGDYLMAYCSSAGAGSYMCGCESMNAYLDLELTGVTGVDACAYAASLCADEDALEPEFTEPAECSLSYQSTGAEWCDIEQRCTQSAELSEGVTVLSSEYQYQSCNLVDETWNCSCYLDDTNVSFELPASVASADACPQALDVCAAGPLVADGAKECSLVYESASLDYCDAELDCTQAGTLGDQPAVAHESSYTWCEQIQDGEWSCDCGQGMTQSTFSLSGTDAWTLCQEAAAICEETIGSAE